MFDLKCRGHFPKMIFLEKNVLRSKKLIFLLVLSLSIPHMGFMFFGREVISRTEKGPHGGKLVYVDQRVPEYVEFVTIKRGGDWLVQVFTYDEKLRPMDSHDSAHVEIVAPNNPVQEVELWNKQHFSLPFISKQSGLLEASVPLGDVKEFTAQVMLRYNKMAPINLTFKYPC